MKALIVDDNADFRTLHIANLRRGLKEHIEPFQAATFAEALRIASEEQPNLIIFDLRLEDQHESAAPDNLVLLKEAAPHSIIIVASGHFDQSIITKVIQSGAHEFIQKGQGMVARLLSAVDSKGRPSTIADAIQIAKDVGRDAGENI
jgi:DNA-binding NtrC family response regulator